VNSQKCVTKNKQYGAIECVLLRGWEGVGYTAKKENQIFLIFKAIQNGTVAKSYTV
jgi:hypothetical protein